MQVWYSAEEAGLDRQGNSGRLCGSSQRWAAVVVGVVRTVTHRQWSRHGKGLLLLIISTKEVVFLTYVCMSVYRMTQKVVTHF